MSYYFNYKRLHNRETQCERKDIIKKKLFYFIFVLQCESIKDVQ